MSNIIPSIVKLGGFIGRKSNDFPGTDTTLKGLDRMQEIAMAFKKFMGAYPTKLPQIAQHDLYYSTAEKNI